MTNTISVNLQTSDVRLRQFNFAIEFLYRIPIFETVFQMAITAGPITINLYDSPGLSTSWNSQTRTMNINFFEIETTYVNMQSSINATVSI